MTVDADPARKVVLGDRTLTAEPVHRLALAVIPVDALARAPIPVPVRVGREVLRRPPGRRRRGQVVDPLARRLDVALYRNGKSAYVLLHRMDLPVPIGEPAVGEASIRLDDPERRYVPRRLRVPVWSRRRVEEPDTDPDAAPVGAVARSIQAWLSPGAAYQPVAGMTGLRGLLRRDGDPVRWPRVRALAGVTALGHAHGDDRGEFLLLLRTLGTITAPTFSGLPIQLQFWVPDPAVPPQPGITEDDPLGGLVIEDAVRRDPAAPPGSVDGAVLRGETIPPHYVPAVVEPRPAESFIVGTLVQPDPYVLA